jgi:uracil-DNA glycosylase
VDSPARFVADLAAASIGDTTNVYSCHDPALDRPEGAAIRADNLLSYLESRRHPTLILVGEAAGYRGCRFSGVPFTSERSLPRDRWTSTRPDAWKEPSATIVHGTLQDLELEQATLLWNAVPTHPARETPLSNRSPTRHELAAGLLWFDRLICLAHPGLVVAVGCSAASILPPGTPRIRHPANGGARAFREQLAALMRESQIRGRPAAGPQFRVGTS